MNGAPRLLPWLVAALFVTGAAAVVAAGLWPRTDDGSPPPRGKPLTAAVSITPREHLFGDPVVARVDVALDRELVDAGEVRVLPRFSPYRRTATTEVMRRDVGRTTLLHYRFRLQCLERACVPRLPSKSFRFPPVVVQYVLHAERGITGLPVRWPPVSVLSLLPPGDVAAAKLRADAADLPSISYRIPPTLLGWLLTGLAASLVLAVGAALALRLRPRPRPVPVVAERVGAGLPPLERALALVERAASEGEEERRTALDELAQALAANGLAAFAPDARRLAWSSRAPRRREMAELAAGVRRALGEGS